MHHYTANTLANSPLIIEDRIRHARRHQARQLQSGAAAAGFKLAEIVRRCSLLNG